MKKILALLLALTLAVAMSIPALAESDKPFAGTQLKVYNW